MDALNAEWSFIDIILAAVGPPIVQARELLSKQDESRFLYNFVKFGVTDYLVKPLCIDEILNLWIHSWRQRKPPKGLEPPTEEH
ncbi:unnamed protein product [Prunus armeniaca]|uniref:Response regulatory domain-containing protein n=1 Tax=Prunus armeniaca TaxID=36596 RepID=A0A6J5XKB1_PRUAR|nr:unnamed protein product [Prunus armeniaca]